MKKNNNKKINNKLSWLFVNIFLFITALIIEIFSDILGSDSMVSKATQIGLAGAAAIASVVSFIISVVTVFKVQGWYVTIPVILSLMSVIIFCLSFFAYEFSGYGSY